MKALVNLGIASATISITIMWCIGLYVVVIS